MDPFVSFLVYHTRPHSSSHFLSKVQWITVNLLVCGAIKVVFSVIRLGNTTVH